MRCALLLIARSALASLVMLLPLSSAWAAGCSASIANRAGDRIAFTATLSTSDPNENGEGEPLTVSTSGGELGTTVGSYSVALPFSYQASTANEAITGRIPGFDGDEGCTISASVNPAQPFTPPQKSRAGDLATHLSIASLGVTLAGGAVCTVATGGVCGAVMIGAAGLGGFAGVAGKISSDPVDPDYTQIATPLITPPPVVSPDDALSASEANAFNALAANQAAIIGLGNAAFVSANRAHGAHQAGDRAWEERQVQATQRYALQLGKRFDRQTTLLADLRSALASAGMSRHVSARDALAFERRLSRSGLPERLTDGLRQFGLTQPDVDAVKSLYRVQDVSAVEGDFPALLSFPGLMGSLHEAARAFSGIPVDIKPGDTTNALNPNSRGVIPVAVLGTDHLDVASTIDPDTARLGPHAARPAMPPQVRDVNGDGVPDLLFHFRTQATGIQCDRAMTVLTVKTYSREMMSGEDTIRTVACHKPVGRREHQHAPPHARSRQRLGHA